LRRPWRSARSWKSCDSSGSRSPSTSGLREPFEGYIRVNEALPTVKVSGGEQRFHRFEFKEWLDRDAYEIVQPDCNTTSRVRSLAHRPDGAPERTALPVRTTGTAVCRRWMNAALVAAIPNRQMLELNQTFNPLKEEVFKEPLVVRRGFMDLPGKPGFGVELADNLAQKFPYIPGSYSKPNPDLPPL